MIKATVNNGMPVRLGLDSGVGSVVLSLTAAEDAGIAMGAEITLPWVGGANVRGRLFENAKLTAAGFTGVIRYGIAMEDSDFSKLFPLDGVLGLSFLKDYLWTVDPKRSLLSLAPVDSTPAERKDSITIPFHLDSNLGIELRVAVSGRSYPLIANTGLSDVFVDTELAKKMDLVGSGPVVKTGPIPYQAGPKVTIGLDGFKVPDVQVFIAQQRGWRHLGQSFFNRFVCTWDMKREQLTLSQP